jgi:hypothetical protein
MELYNKDVHGNKKVKIGKRKYRVSELKKMTEEELMKLYEEVNELIGIDLETLWVKYSENLLLKEAGLPYGTDLLIDNEKNTPTNGPTI